MSIIDCPECGGTTNSIAPTCIHCYCLITPVRPNPVKVIMKKDKYEIDRAERIARIKETVDIVFVRIVLLSVTLFLSLQSIAYLFRAAPEYMAKISEIQREKELLKAAEEEKQQTIRTKEEFQKQLLEEEQKIKDLNDLLYNRPKRNPTPIIK